jgi:hypothetical protein
MADRNWDLYIRGLIITYILFTFIFGALAIANGFSCAACGELGTRLIGAVSIALGVAGIISLAKIRSVPANLR